eukprot:g9127.t1
MAAPGDGTEDDKMQKFINKDMKDHPECRYSLSSQKECSSTNGNFACETIRRVFRNCPGLRPEQVYDMTTRDTGTVPKPPGGGDGGDGGIPIFGGRASQQQRGGNPMIVPPDDWPFGGKGMDDLFGNLQDRINSFFKDSPFPQPDPDINHGGGFGAGGGGDRGAEPSWKSTTTTPRVPPPHKGQQSASQPRGGEKQAGAGEATKDGSVVARA